MNEDVIADLKQFISSTVAQAVAGLATLDKVQSLQTQLDSLQTQAGSLQTQVNCLQDQMHSRFDDLDLKLTTIADAQAEELADHDRRLTRLEQRAA